MKVFAHRGASGYAPENTIVAIKKAIEMKADGIEIDIQLTKDGKIVVMHDWKVDRTTTGRGYVYELDYDYIKTLDAGQWFSKDFIGEAVPTLEEVLEYANDSEYGLTSSVYTTNLNTAFKAVNGLKFGETYINRENFEAMQGFHAGRRKSGIGGADGKHGLEEYLTTQVVYMQLDNE